MGAHGVVTYKRATFLERLQGLLQLQDPKEAGVGLPASFQCACLACPVAAAVPDVTSACAREQIITHPGGQLIDLELLFSSRLRLGLLPEGRVSNSPSLADLRMTCALLHTGLRNGRTSCHHMSAGHTDW